MGRLDYGDGPAPRCAWADHAWEWQGNDQRCAKCWCWRHALLEEARQVLGVPQHEMTALELCALLAIDGGMINDPGVPTHGSTRVELIARALAQAVGGRGRMAELPKRPTRRRSSDARHDAEYESRWAQALLDHIHTLEHELVLRGVKR